YESARRAGYDPRTGGAGNPFSWGFGGGTGGARTVSPEEFEQMFGDGGSPFSDFFSTFFGGGAGPRTRTRARRPAPEHELTITLEEAFTGTTRKVTLTGPDGERTIEVRFPAGIRDGQKVRAASGGGDVYFRVRLAPHPRFEVRGTED